jgi:hypothetical protein
MKSLFFAAVLILFMSFPPIHPQNDCPASVSPIKKNVIIKWYLNETGMSNASFKRQIGGPNLSIDVVRGIVRSAISSALSSWSYPSGVTSLEGSSGDRNLEIQFIPMAMNEWGQAPPPHANIYINYNQTWTDYSNLVTPTHWFDDINTLVLHEMGHIFGATHSQGSSVMDYSNLNVKRSLTQCDYNMTLNAYNPMYSVTVKNGFGVGNMSVDGVTYSVPTNGMVFLWRERTFPHSLQAVDQNYSGSGTTYMMRFNDWSGENYSNMNRAISIVAQNNTYGANFRKEFNIGFRNNFVGISNGGIINVNNTQYNAPTQNFPVIDGNQISASALYQVINGIQYTFSNWANDGSTQSSRSFAPNDHSTYTANFTGKPSNAGRYLTYGTTVNQPIRLYWTDNPNTNVTQYKIWRRVKHNGVVYPDELIATVNRGVQTYQDWEYALTSTYSHDLLWYDSRGYYTTEGSYAEPDFAAVFGRELAKGNSLASSNLPTECKAENYPNPFNPSTIIKYQLPEAGHVNLIVYDVLGNKIAQLVNEIKQAGVFEVEFSASLAIPSGVYFYCLQVGEFVETKKMILLR